MPVKEDLHMSKYLILRTSLLLALPSYAAVFDGGSWAKNCVQGTTPYTIVNAWTEAGKMTINITEIKLGAGVDNRGLTVTGPRFDCFGFRSPIEVITDVISSANINEEQKH